MKLSDDEINWIAALLYNSKSKLLTEYDEAKMIRDKICSESRKISSTKSRQTIKPGDWS
jgi:FAD synthase